MYIMCVMLFINLSCGVGALQISVIIIIKNKQIADKFCFFKGSACGSLTQ